MAFAVLIGSVPETQALEFRAGERPRLEASRIVRCSHLLASWVTVSPLNRILREAIDGGQPLRADLWHPWRPPVFHTAASAHLLHRKLIEALDLAIQEKGVPPADDWYAVEIGKVIDVFAHAAARGEGIVRFLEPPQDEERAGRVSIPIDQAPA
jgi:hypothetical protein